MKKCTTLLLRILGALLLGFGTVVGWAQTPLDTAPICDVAGQPQTLLMTDADTQGMALRLEGARMITLPGAVQDLFPTIDMVILRYASERYISYQRIADEPHDRASNMGISMPDVYRKVYGLTPVTPVEDAAENISGVREMMHISCESPNFRRYVLRGGDEAVVQLLDGRYWVIVFMHDNARLVHNLEFRGFSEAEVLGTLASWRTVSRVSAD